VPPQGGRAMRGFATLRAAHQPCGLPLLSLTQAAAGAAVHSLKRQIHLPFLAAPSSTRFHTNQPPKKMNDTLYILPTKIHILCILLRVYIHGYARPCVSEPTTLRRLAVACVRDSSGSPQGWCAARSVANPRIARPPCGDTP
jgi:hypothetical protein